MTTPSAKFSSFLPTSIFLSQNWEQSWLKLQTTLTDMSYKVNMRQLGFFHLLETPNGQEWFKDTTHGQPRQGVRQVYRFGAIAAGANLLIPMNIFNASPLEFTHIYGTVKTDAPDDRPLNYADEAVVTNQISLKVNAGNIEIFVGATSPNVLSGLVILEYLKN